MTIYRCGEHEPVIGQKVFIAPNAQVMGEVTLGDHSNIWFGVVARGDINKIKIGENTNIQDLSMLHVVGDTPLIIGNNVTIGHKVTLHACTVEDNCLIGMGATILDGAVIGKNSLVAAGSLVPPGKIYPPGSFIIGSPAKVKRELTTEEKEEYGNHYKTYIKNKEKFLSCEYFEEVERHGLGGVYTDDGSD